MKRHYVYSLLNADERVLYVGCSGDPSMRLRRHLDRPWGNEIAEMRVIPCEHREAAVALERSKIADTQPKYNVDDNPRRSKRPYGVRQQQVLDLLVEHGPMTQVQAEEWFRDHGVDNSRSFTGMSLSRLKGKGLVEVIDQVPSKSGRWKTAALFAATTKDTAA